MKLLALTAMVGMLDGCWWSGVAPELRRVQSHIELLTVRISRLEQSRGLASQPEVSVGARASEALATSSAPSIPGAALAASEPLVSVGARASEALATSSAPSIPGAALAASQTLGSGETGPMAGQVPGARSSWFPQIAWGKAFRKLIRGAINTITGWVEIPKRVDETSNTSGVGLGLTVGLLRGAGYGFVRTVAGMYEMVTFPFPAPPGYRSVIRPEYVFTCECPDARSP